MTEQDSTPDEGQEPEAKDDTEQAPESATPKSFDADYVKQLRAEAARHRKEAQEARAKAQEYEDRDKSELEKLTTKVAKLEADKANAETQLLRFEVAKEKEIPAEAIDLLNGKSREDLEASADKILNLVKSRTDNQEPPDFDGGAREPAPDADPETAHNQLVADMILGKRD